MSVAPKYSMDLRPQSNTPSSTRLSVTPSLPSICVTSPSNCDIWLQIKPKLDATLTLDAG